MGQSDKGDSRKLKLLVVDDEENMRHMLSALLTKSDYQVESASNGQDALKRVQSCKYNFILCDLKMPRMDGMDFLIAARSYLSATTVIMMSAYGTIDRAVEAMKKGAYDFISKPFKPDEVLLALKKAEERERLKLENVRLKERLHAIEQESQFGNMVGKSLVMQSVFKLSMRVAQYNTTVLITGESGTGKELIAKGIHFSSKRSDMPFVAVNCASIPEQLLESELFGYKKGSFTGADKDRRGLFADANHGTVFLDEIGEMPLSLQVKLLRVLQESEIHPIGSSKPEKIDVRVVAATSRNLAEEVKSEEFRQDLYYRLNVLPIELPSLRQRSEDIPLLCHFFLRKYTRALKREIKAISPAAMACMISYSWPGNVRELENVIERAVVLADTDVLEMDCLPDSMINPAQAANEPDPFYGFSLKVARRNLETRLIQNALKATKGNRTQASKILEISHPSLLSKIKAYDIKV